MFTGLIQEVGRLSARSPLKNGLKIRVSAQSVPAKLGLGDSIAVNGVCQTVTAKGADWFEVDAVADTLTKTTLASLNIGTPVNLECAVTAGTPLGGHLVSGHVGGIGRVLYWQQQGDGWGLLVSLPESLAAYVTAEGSLTIDGISLTVAEITSQGARLSIIPHTRGHTNLKHLRLGQSVNLEADLVAKYLDSLLQKRQQTGGLASEKSHNTALSLDRLRAWGY